MQLIPELEKYLVDLDPTPPHIPIIKEKGGDQDAASNWGWMMLILKPQFIKGEL